jgi:hypothetical protein
MLWTILLAFALLSTISAVVAWFRRATLSVVSTYVETKQGVEKDKRARAIAETRTATELWAADDDRAIADTATEVPLPSGHVLRVRGRTGVYESEKLARAYLIAKHGDNISAYDAWRKASNGRADELTALYSEVFAWKKARQQ